MTDELKPCPNGCSSAGEIWNGEGLEVCPVCHGNTVVPTPAAPQGAPETIWLWFSDISNNIRKWSKKPFNQGTAYTRKDLSDARIAELEHALKLILPLARGYNPPGQSKQAHKTCWSWIEVAVEALKTPEGDG